MNGNNFLQYAGSIYHNHGGENPSSNISGVDTIFIARPTNVTEKTLLLKKSIIDSWLTYIFMKLELECDIKSTKEIILFRGVYA